MIATPVGSTRAPMARRHGRVDDLLTEATAPTAGVAVLFVTGVDWLPVAIVGLLVALLWWAIGVAERRHEAPLPVAEP
jgi:hypothetical protein